MKKLRHRIFSSIKEELSSYFQKGKEKKIIPLVRELVYKEKRSYYFAMDGKNLPYFWKNGR